VNGDGYGDVVIGAEAYQNGEEAEGRALAFLGSAAGLAAEPAWIAEGSQAGARFGHAVAAAGDVDGDGFADVVIGADGHDGAELDAGRAYLYLGGPAGLAAAPSWTMTGDQPNGLLGSAVASAGDVNGDGFSEVAIGVPFDPAGGTVRVYLGSRGGPAVAPSWTAASSQGAAAFGMAVAGAADMNGDGSEPVGIRHDRPRTRHILPGERGRACLSPYGRAEADQLRPI
jgi:hypothetical protein